MPRLSLPFHVPLHVFRNLDKISREDRIVSKKTRINVGKVFQRRADMLSSNHASVVAATNGTAFYRIDSNSLPKPCNHTFQYRSLIDTLWRLLRRKEEAHRRSF